MSLLRGIYDSSAQTDTNHTSASPPSLSPRMRYWPAQPSDLLETHLPLLLRFVLRLNTLLPILLLRHEARLIRGRRHDSQTNAAGLSIIHTPQLKVVDNSGSSTCCELLGQASRYDVAKVGHEPAAGRRRGSCRRERRWSNASQGEKPQGSVSAYIGLFQRSRGLTSRDPKSGSSPKTSRKTTCTRYDTLEP